MAGEEVATIHRELPCQYDCTFELEDHGAGAGSTAYYARLTQEDGEMAWASPVYCG
jgi:hypothetical protein